MIQPQTRLKVADNTGAKEILCIRVLSGSSKRYAGIGDIIKASVKQAAPNGQVKKGEVVNAEIERVSKEYVRPDSSHIRFDDNAAAITAAGNNLPRTRIYGPVARGLRERECRKRL